MNVLFLTNNPIPGGTARVLLDWLRLGSENGLTASVGLLHRGDLEMRVRELDVPHRILAMPWPDRRRPWQMGKALAAAAYWARRQGVEHVHCQEHDVYPFGRLLARLLGVPVTCHVQFRVEREFVAWAFGGKRRPGAVIWTSEQQRQDCREATAGILDEDIQVTLPMGLDVERFAVSAPRRNALRRQWRIEPGQIAVGAASAIRDRKEIHTFIDMVVNLRAKHQNVIGVFAGGAVADELEYAERIEPRLRALDVEGALRWVGHLEPVEPFYHAIDLFVSTSRYETFGMSVCEAMACGRPVAGYRGGSVGEVVGDTGRIVETGDADGLTAAVDELVSDDALRQELGQQARRRVETKFNPAQSLEKLEAIFQSVRREKAAAR